MKKTRKHDKIKLKQKDKHKTPSTKKLKFKLNKYTRNAIKQDSILEIEHYKLPYY
ncbi:hypothetical protein HYD82_00965 [Mycoplasmopsis bovis]|nr:hypothetical protein HYD82_00965 [Mycoplasmopsis bovis]